MYKTFIEKNLIIPYVRSEATAVYTLELLKVQLGCESFDCVGESSTLLWVVDQINN